MLKVSQITYKQPFGQKLRSWVDTTTFCADQTASSRGFFSKHINNFISV